MKKVARTAWVSAAPDAIDVLRAGMHHAVGASHFHLDVFDDRETDLDAEFFLDALCPGEVREQAVDGQTEQLAVHAAEGVGMLLKTDELGGADGREIGGVREQDQPLAFVIGKAAIAMGSLGLEGRSGFVEVGESGGGVIHAGLLERVDELSDQVFRLIQNSSVGRSGALGASTTLKADWQC